MKHALPPWLKLFLFLPFLAMESPTQPNTGPLPKRVLFVAIDSLDPVYLGMNASATGPGGPGNWLMPNVRAFARQSTWWPRAVGVAPHTTDANHISAISATHSGHNGLIGVMTQTEAWDEAGLNEGPIHMSKTRYPDGTPRVVTLFDLVKQRTGGAAKTAIISNKGWIGEAFRDLPGTPVDTIVNGMSVPGYLQAPVVDPAHFWDNPATDADAACDPESPIQTDSLLNGWAQAKDHPRDRWIADASITIASRDAPDLMYILLGDLDHGQHFLGEVHDPSEWEPIANPTLPPGCVMKPQYRLVSKRNPSLYKEAALDLIRDVDLNFGYLMSRLNALGYLNNTIVVLLSDHSMANHIARPGLEAKTDVTAILKAAGLAPEGDYRFFGASSMTYLYWRPLYKLGNPNVISQAAAALRSPNNRVWNPATGQLEMPWDVLTRTEMLLGSSTAGISPKHFFNPWVVQVANNPTNPAYDSEVLKSWPDLIVILRNGWELPSILGGNGLVNAGHGGPDTAAVALAVSGLAFPPAAVCRNAVSLPDVGLTVAQALGLSFPSTVNEVARSLTCVQ